MSGDIEPVEEAPVSVISVVTVAVPLVLALIKALAPLFRKKR